MSNSLQPCGLQHRASLSFTLSAFGQIHVCWVMIEYYPTISSSVIPFSSCPQSFPASGSFLINWLFTSGGHSIGASASASVLPVIIQGWFPLKLTGLISLQSKGLYKSLLQHHSSKASVLQNSVFFMVQLSLLYMTTGKTIALIIWTFVSKVMSLLFNMLVCVCHSFLPRSKCLLISWLQSSSTVILEPRKIKFATASNLSQSFNLSICHEMMRPDAMILFFWMLSFKQVFFILFFHPHQEGLWFLFTFCC